MIPIESCENTKNIAKDMNFQTVTKVIAPNCLLNDQVVINSQKLV